MFLLLQIGLVGLVEEAWIDTLATVDPEEITFVDFVEEGRLLARQLKDQVKQQLPYFTVLIILQK